MSDQQEVKPLPYLEFVRGALLQIQGSCKDDVSFKVSQDALKMCNEVELEGNALAKERNELASQVMRMRDALENTRALLDGEMGDWSDFYLKDWQILNDSIKLPILPAEKALREKTGQKS